MAEYLAPGVYVEEFDSGIKAMEGAGTSTAGFVGMAEKGRTQGVPVLITSVGDFQRNFGGQLSKAEYGENRYLPYAVEGFFGNGGSTCYVMRIIPENATSAEGKIPMKSVDIQYAEIIFTASSAGKWGNVIAAEISEDYTYKTNILKKETDGEKLYLTVDNAAAFSADDVLRLTSQDCSKENAETEYTYFIIDDINGSVLTITAADIPEYEIADTSKIPKNFLQVCALKIIVTSGNVSELFENVSLNPSSPYYIETIMIKSALVNVQIKSTTETKSYSLKCGNLLLQAGAAAGEKVVSIRLSGGENGDTFSALTPGMLKAGEDVAGKRMGLNAFKDLSDVSIMAIPGYHGANNDAVQAELISHCEGLKNRFAILDAGVGEITIPSLTAYKDKFDSTYAALYHPWLQVYSGVEKSNVLIPPSGAVAGIYARTDNTRGVWKAPANEIVRGVTGLSVNYNEAEQGKLNPKGINLIRSIPGSGIRVWGARTLSSDGNWKYVNVRRLFIYIEESIKANTNWAVFEPNDAGLWSRVQGTIKVFLTTLWRNGALVGTSADEAFFVNVGKGSTMTEDDILNGRLICVIGVAPVRPAEFIIFRITQKMQDSE